MEKEFTAFLGQDPVATAFWGGGTPGLLPAGDLERLGRAQIRALGPPAVEWTVEMAPSTVRPDKLAVLKDLGVNRISLGVQSFQDTMLESLGRRQSARQALKAYEMIRNAGFRNVNIDLIFSVPGQTMELWFRDLERIAELKPEHVSTYCLTFEEDTALYVKLSQGKIVQDVEREADFYEETWERLDAMGLKQYEVSNFARPGMQCLHNLNTWRMHEWIGFGPSAASQHGGRRFSNEANLEKWMFGIDEARPARMEDSELSMGELALDSIVFGLRMNAGVDLAGLEGRFPGFDMASVEPFLQELVGQGFAVSEGRRYALTLSGLMVVDRIGSELLCR